MKDEKITRYKQSKQIEKSVRYEEKGIAELKIEIKHVLKAAIK